MNLHYLSRSSGLLVFEKKNYIDLLEIRFNIPISVRTSCTRSQRIVHAGDRDWQKTLCMDSQRRFSWLRSTTSWQRNNTSREPDRNAYVLGLKAWHLHSQETTGELKTFEDCYLFIYWTFLSHNTVNFGHHYTSKLKLLNLKIHRIYSYVLFPSNVVTKIRFERNYIVFQIWISALFLCLL